MSEAVSVTKPKGRGKDLKPRKKRTDCTANLTIPADDRQRIIKYNRALMMLGKLKDKNNLEELQARINLYFDLNEQFNMLPSVAAFALSLGVDRRTLWDWIAGGRDSLKNPQCVDTLKDVYNSINAQYELLLNDGGINPVSAFFLLKNNHGYKDQTDHIITARAEAPETEEELTQRAALLGEGGVD